MNKINIPVISGKKGVLAKDIIRIESSSNYSRIYTSERVQPYLVAKVLRWFELNLPNDIFIRVHNSHLINTMYMKEFTNYSARRSDILLTNGERISISRRKKSGFLSTCASLNSQD